MKSVDQINSLLAQLKHNLILYWNRYRDGLNNFETRMSFASDQEAEAHYLKVALKAVAKQALDTALDALGEAAGPAGKLISTCKAVVEAWVEEKERAEKAEGQVKIADYIESIRNGIGDQEKLMSDAIDAEQHQLLREFRRIASDDLDRGQASEDGVVVGEGAHFLNQLQERVDAFKAAIPEAAFFQERFTENFANTPGLSDLISHGGRPSGTLYLQLKLYREPYLLREGGKWTIKEVQEHWTLVTSAPDTEPQRLATSLARSLAEQNKKPWQSDLPKIVRMNIEREEDGLNSYEDGSIYFESDPERYEVRGIVDYNIFGEAWAQPEIRARVMEVSQIEGTDE
jgi:hypothetical protein